MKNKIKKFIKEHIKEIIIVCVLVIAILIYFIVPSFANLIPVKSVVITSEHSSFEDNEPGAWQVTKSGEWTGRGEATVTFDVDTTLKTSTRYTDVIFVLDISGSMSGNKLDRVKSDSIDLINTLLSNTNNRAALITFDTTSTIISGLTNDVESLTNQINELTTTGSTNYYQALVNVDSILQNYTKEDDKEMVVLFLTDGYPNVDTPNQIAQYEYLKKQYPYITINGIQYEMGNTILEPITQISDNQYLADMETLNNVLLTASTVAASYETYQISDYIENDYFYLDSVDDISVSQGTVDLTEEDNRQKVTWTITNFKSGGKATLSMKLQLKDEFIGQGGIYPTNESEEIISKIEDTPDEDVLSTLTPVLEDDYRVIYDGNNPGGCTISNVPEAANYSVYDTVAISQEELTCSGYEFKGWEITTDNITKVNDDYFIMPESDVTIRAIWSKIELAKSMDGAVYSVPDFYDVIASQAVMDNTSSEFVSSSSGINFGQISSDTNGKGVYERAGTEDDDYPVYYYRGDVDNNHVKFADFCWKAVRTTSTGGVKLIYDGKPDANGTCDNSGADSQIGTSEFNLYHVTSSFSQYDYKYIGYMYGNDNLVGTQRVISDNSTNSTIKSYIDEWYSNNMMEFADYLEDTIWCNDRSFYNSMYYSATGRLSFDYNPSLSCSYLEDSFTVNSQNGNGKLMFPVGLLTADEVALAGQLYNSNNQNYYLNTGQSWWTLSPGQLVQYMGMRNYVFCINSSNYFMYDMIDSIYGVRPSVSLVPEIKVISGTGSSSDPYVVDKQ